MVKTGAGVPPEAISAASRRRQCARQSSAIRYCPSSARYRYRGGNGCTDQSPPGHCGGASASPRRGDSAGKACGTSYLFPLHYSLKTFPFPHGFVLWWSANCESLSHASGVPAPFHKGAILRPVSVACPPLIPYSLKKGLPFRAALCFYSSALASAIIFAWLALGTSSYRSNFNVKEPLAWVMARRSMA